MACPTGLSEGGKRTRTSLIPSGHMLGAVQVSLQLADGRTVGYSGDFGWPLDAVVQVDELVVDSTYGSPRSVRHYTQRDAELRLVELVCARLRHGPVHVKAYRGTIERVIHVVGCDLGVPMLGSNRLLREVEVYRRYGFASERVLALESDEGQAALRERSYVRLYSRGDNIQEDGLIGTSIVVSAFMIDRFDPVRTYSDRAHRVGLSNHADFNGTLAYVEATGARRVVADNTRNHGVQLALEIQRRLGIAAVPSSNREGIRWR